MASRHSTGRHGAAKSDIRGRKRLATAGIDKTSLDVSGSMEMRLLTGYGLLSFILEASQNGAPPFNDPKNPLLYRQLEVVRDILGEGLPVRSAANRVRKRSAGARRPA